MGEERAMHRVMVKNHQLKRPLGRPRRRWEYNIKMDLQEDGGVGEYRIELAQDRDRWRAVVSTVRKFGFHNNAGNILTTCKDLLAFQKRFCSVE
jgi:hypothetical protein